MTQMLAVPGVAWQGGTGLREPVQPCWLVTSHFMHGHPRAPAPVQALSTYFLELQCLKGFPSHLEERVREEGGLPKKTYLMT